MGSLSFRFGECADSNDHEVRILVDGVDILKRVDDTALGLDPPEFFAQRALLESGELLVGRCSCGCVGCCDVSVAVEYAGAQVRWSSQHCQIDGLVFDRSEYLAAIEVGRSETGWETKERRAERLVAELDFGWFERQGMRFDWASARIDKEKVALSFTAGDRQQLFYVDWDHHDPEAAKSHVRRFIEQKERS